MSFFQKLFRTPERESAHSLIGVPLEPDDPYEDRLRFGRFIGSAETGDPKQQAIVAVFFADGKGVPQDYVEAYKWSHLAMSQGVHKAGLVRDFVARRMTADQILEGQKRAAAFVPQHVER